MLCGHRGNTLSRQRNQQKTCRGDIRRRKCTVARRRCETDKVVCLFLFLILYAISCSAMWTQFRTKRSKNRLTNRHSLYARGQTKFSKCLIDSVHGVTRGSRQKRQCVWSGACDQKRSVSFSFFFFVLNHNGPVRGAWSRSRELLEAGASLHPRRPLRPGARDERPIGRAMLFFF
jgi:hypothetical protein